MKLLILGTLLIFGMSDATYASTENSTASNQQQSKEDKTKKIDTTNSTIFPQMKSDYSGGKECMDLAK
jgi:hypothetical protein